MCSLGRKQFYSRVIKKGIILKLNSTINTYDEWGKCRDELRHALLVILQTLQFSFLSSLDAVVHVNLTLLNKKDNIS